MNQIVNIAAKLIIVVIAGLGVLMFVAMGITLLVIDASK